MYNVFRFTVWNWALIKKENANLSFDFRSGTKKNKPGFLQFRKCGKRNKMRFSYVNILQLINLGNLYSYPILKIHNSLFSY